MSTRQKKTPLILPKKVENAKVAKIKKVNIDIVTGKAMSSVFFDPAKSTDCHNTDYDWIGENLYIPASVVKEDSGILTVRLPNGEVYKMSNASRVTDNDDEGVDDILKLRDFSEMSLVHTLRVRYYKDEVYTFVGPILISLNPYKRIKDIYTTKTMEAYHGQKQVIITIRLTISNIKKLMKYITIISIGRASPSLIRAGGECLHLSHDQYDEPYFLIEA